MFLDSKKIKHSTRFISSPKDQGFGTSKTIEAIKYTNYKDSAAVI
jgi:hypothetical protein